MFSAVPHLQKQFNEIQNDSICGFSVGLIHDDLYRWRVTLLGPPKTAYESGAFPLLIEFPIDFPTSPPSIRFLCPMYHPNVRDSGEVCISILMPADQADGDCWLPARTVASVLIFLISLLSDPNCEAPENIDTTRTYVMDKVEYARKVQRTIEQTGQIAHLR
jgi:ubiquitin-conjugating enzyme E2 G1